MDNKERIGQGGGENTEWDNLASEEFSAEKAEKRAAAKAEQIEGRAAEEAERGEKTAAKAEKAAEEVERSVAKKRGEVAEPEKSIEQQFKAVEKENRGIVHPKVVEFLAGKEPKLPDGENPSDYLVYNVSAEKRGAVKKELAGQAFEDQIFKAENFKDFLAANRLAAEIEANQDIPDEIKERISEYKNDPASGYMAKKAYFELESNEAAIERDKETLRLAEEQYNEARAGGFLKRLFNRKDIKQKKERMEWTQARITDAEGKLNAQRTAFVQANAARKEALASRDSQAAGESKAA